MAAAGWGGRGPNSAQTPGKLRPCGLAPHRESRGLRAKRKRRKNRKPNAHSELPSPRSGVRHTEKRPPAQDFGSGTRTRCPPATRWQRPPHTGAAPPPGGGFSSATTHPSRGSRPRAPRPMAEPGPPLPVAQRHVHQHSRSSFPLHPPPFPHHPPSQPSSVARALVSQRRDDVRHSGVHIRRRLMPGCRDRGGRARWDSCATPAAGASSLCWAEAERDRPAGRVELDIAGTGVAERGGAPGRTRCPQAARGAPLRAGCAFSLQPAVRGPPWARP
ncbi:basic salivary proline-rich protein 2-like [Motacilla alba alba]|uniref:basic salivary proline-rich protein 2-like n=1 Tax=Motacilla alba alba TaxID=1094192 RepID=UPI0018D5074B|nr:basic salivary proline-rich protein 2-like [Motacilla alba alba]XP_037997078.1 basic salivary proline-rich protein 2-like [Motacilla alba alba]